MLDDKIKRVISAAVLVLLILVFIIMGGIIFKVGALTIIAIALYEYINVYKKTENCSCLYCNIQKAACSVTKNGNKN